LPEKPNRAHLVHVAGREVLTPRKSESFQPFLRKPSTGATSGLHRLRIAHFPTISKHVKGVIAGEDREVECRFGPGKIAVRIEGIATFSVTGNGRSVELVEAEDSAALELVEEAILGPPLLLALALQGVTCLHAGAVATEDGVVAFLGRSGAGKSTLAAFLNREVAGWQRCADDLLPMDEGPDGIDALPHFPQPKLPPERQWCGQKPERLPLRALYVLGEEALPGSGVTTESMSVSNATAEVLQNSAVWTLFPPELMDRHLAVCARIAETVPVRRLAYPRRFEILPEVAAAIRADLEGHT